MGDWFMSGITTSDHKKKIETTTFTSIGRYLDQNGLLEEMVVLNQNIEPLIISL